MNIRLMQLSTLQLVEAAPDVSSAMLLIEENIHKVMLECIPKSNGRAKKHTEWITENLLNLFRQKSKAYRKWKKCESNTWRATYKLYVKQIKKGIFMAKKDFFLKSLDGCHDPGSFWRGLNRFTGRKQREDIPTLNTQSGGEAITDKEKAEVLMLQFASVFQSSETEVNISLNSPSTVEFISKASVKRIHQIITQIPNKKAPGCDGIPMVVIKNCALVLAPCLTVLTDRILNDGIFPKTSKVATVIPIPKVQLSQTPSDYRPISLLPLLGKVIEKHINDMVLDHIEPQLSDLQFGFRKSRSTTDAILLFQHYIFRGFEACEKSKRAANVVAVYFDIAKAFDTVPHSTLLNYLHTRFNVPTHLMAVLNSYLANRTMRVKVGNSLSNSCMVTSGGPHIILGIHKLSL
jgi:hypothetical protein